MKIAKFNGTPEIFHTIQGEGHSLGMPSVFLRLSLCNLHCVWCDTDYTWNFENTPFPHVRDGETEYNKYKKEDVILETEPEEIVPIITAFGCPNLVVTGGEPLLQQEDLVKIIHSFRDSFDSPHVEIETNGTILPATPIQQMTDQYNVSPKLANSGNDRHLREKKDVYSWFAAEPKAFFKFVLDSSLDLNEVLALVSRYHIPASRVYLMPQGTDEATLREKRIWLADICKQYGFYFTDRLHIHLYGNRRGV